MQLTRFAPLALAAMLAACSPNAITNRFAPQPKADGGLTNQPQASTARPLAAGPRPTAATVTSAPPVPTLAPAQTTALEQEQRVLVELYRRTSPSVVSIEVIGNHPHVDGGNAPSGPLPIGQGSGFLFDDQGHIVTNNHVVEGAQVFQINFADGTMVPGELIGTDPGSDLAVIRVDKLPAGVAPLSIGDSHTVEVGQTAIAIGNPFGLQNTLTVGVISGLGRDLDGPTLADGGRFSIPNIIQTDAAINPGNSGGPLLNIKGEVIGVNSAISTDSGRFEGVGYAIPSETVARVVPALIDTGSYAHPWLGVSMDDLTTFRAQQLGIIAQPGILVIDVVVNGPSAKAGLRGDPRAGQINAPQGFSGDIITAIDGQRVRRTTDLRSYIEQNKAVGEHVTLTVLRDGKETTLDVTLEARPGQ